jgi:hypothetical protein
MKKIFGRDSCLSSRFLSRALFPEIVTREKKGERGKEQAAVIERTTIICPVGNVDPDFRHLVHV